MNPIPVSIFTGFLGAGKTTLINEIVKQNPQLKFGFIINEFGEVGVDGQLVKNTGEELIELSNGCICCVVRDDLVKAAEKVINTGKVDYIIIETSGLAEPLPVAQTFSVNTLSGKLNLDAIVCLVDCINFKNINDSFKIAKEQIACADIIVVNKINKQKEDVVDFVLNYIQELNPYAVIIKNDGNIDTKLIIDTGKWSVENLTKHEGLLDDHEHEHDKIDEIVFTTDRLFDIKKLDKWVEENFPLSVVRAKGFLRIRGYSNDEILCLLQVAGAKRELRRFLPTRDDFDATTSRIVFIGKELDKQEIFTTLEKTLI